MVDSIGTKPVTTIAQRSVVRTEATTRVAAPAPAPDGVAASTVAASLSASPPINLERVGQIRRAIEEGRFPLSPSTIADRLIALRLDWSGRDQA